MKLSRRAFLAVPLAAQGFQAPEEFRFVALGQSLVEHDLRTQEYPGRDALQKRLAWGQVVFSNMESPLRGGEEKADPDVLKHSAPVEVLDCLRDYHVNLLSLANNHAFDFGARGIERTLQAARGRGFGVAGAGSNLAEAEAPGYFGARPARVGLLAFASKMNLPEGVASAGKAGANHLAMSAPGQLDGGDMTRILKAIGETSEQADYVVVYHHDHFWEKDNSQTAQWKVEWAHRCVEAGATVFVSHGAPLLQGIEIYRGRPIFYDLGNFIFQTRKSLGEYPASAWQSVVARCRFRGGKLISLELDPIVLNESGEEGERFFETRGRPALATGAQGEAILTSLKKASERFGCGIKSVGGRGVVEL